MLEAFSIITPDRRVDSLVIIVVARVSWILALGNRVVGLRTLTEYHVLFSFGAVHIHHYLLVNLLLRHLKADLLILLVMHFVQCVAHSRRRGVIVVLGRRGDIDIGILLILVSLVG